MFGAVASALRRVHEASLALVLGTPAERGAAARSKAIAFARSRHRRDRVVAWLCEFRNLNAFDRSLAGRVEEARSADATIASRAMEELLALCYVLLADADVWVRLGGEPMASSALTSLAAAAGAACRHDPRLAWRALPLFLRALRSPHPELRGGAAEALCDDIAILNHGQLVANKSKSALMAGARAKEVRLTLAGGTPDDLPAALAALGARPAEGGIAVRYDPSASSVGAIIAAVAAAGLEITDVTTDEPDLEEVFLEMTGGTA